MTKYKEKNIIKIFKFLFYSFKKIEILQFYVANYSNKFWERIERKFFWFIWKFYI